VTSPTAAPETLGCPPRVTVEVPGGARVAVFDHPAPEPAPGTPTVVLAHGWCLTHETWDPVVTELQHRRPDVRVLTYDQPGHGLSTSPDSRRAEITDLGRTLEAVLADRVPDGELVLAGHSMGGMTVMSLGALAPDLLARRVRGVGLFGTAAHLGHRRGLPGERFVIGLLAHLPATAKGLPTVPALTAHNLFGDRPDTAAVRAVSRMTRRTRANVVADWFGALGRMDLRESLSPFATIPTVLTTGTRDRLTPVSAGRRTAAAIPGSTFWSLPGVGHMLTYEATDAVVDRLGLLLDAEPAGQRA